MKSKKAIGLLSLIATIALIVTLGSSLAMAQEVQEAYPGAFMISEAAAAEADEKVCPVSGDVCTGEARYANQNRPDQSGNPAGEGYGDRKRLQLMDGSCAADPDAAQVRRESQRTEEGKGRGRMMRSGSGN